MIETDSSTKFCVAAAQVRQFRTMTKKMVLLMMNLTLMK